MRVRVNYTIEKQTANGFEVRLNAIEKNSEQGSRLFDETDSRRVDGTGQRPDDVEDAWFGETI